VPEIRNKYKGKRGDKRQKPVISGGSAEIPIDNDDKEENASGDYLPALDCDWGIGAAQDRAAFMAPLSVIINLGLALGAFGGFVAEAGDVFWLGVVIDFSGHG